MKTMLPSRSSKNQILTSLAVGLCLLFGISNSFGQTALTTWDMSTQPGGANNFGFSPLAPSSKNSNLTTTSGNLTRGTGVTQSGTAAARGWGGNGWSQTTSSDGIINSKFITFNVTPKIGFAVSLTGLSPFSYRRSGSGTPNGLLEYEIGSGYISQSNLSFISNSSSGANLTTPVNFTGDVDLQDRNGAISLRITPYGATDIGGTFYIFDVGNSTASDFTINGRILGSETTTLTNFFACFGLNGTSQNFTVKGDGLTTSNVVLTAPTDYEISTDNTTFSASLNVTPSSGSVNQIIYVRLKSSASTGVHSGTVTITGGGFTPTANLGVAVSGTVNSTPTAGVLSGTATICSDASTNLSVAITGGTSPYTVVYSGGTVNSYISGAAIPVSPASTTSYTLTSVTDFKGCVVASPSGGATVTVNARPTSGIIAGTATICSGQSTNLAVTIVGSASPYTVVYTDGSSNFTENGYVSATAIPVSPTSTKTYTIVSITDANGCTVASPSGSAVVTVNPTPSAGVLSGTATICSDASTNLSVAITGGTSPFSVVYSGGSVNNYTTGAAIPVSPASSTTYTLTSVTDANGCTVASPSGTAVVTVNQRPSAAVLSGDATICSGLTTPLFVNITGGQTPFIVVTSGGTTNSYSSGDAITKSPTTTTTYTLTSVTDNNGCTVASPTGTAVVTVNPTPVGTNTTVSAICSGTVVGYDLTTNVAVSSTYSWVAASNGNVSGESTSAQTGSTITDNLVSNNGNMFNQNVVYTVTPTSVTGSCVGLPFTVTVPVKPRPIGLINASPATICNGASSTLTISGILTNNSTIVYSDGTNTSSVSTGIGGSTTVSVSPTTNTTYTIVSATLNGCTENITGISTTIIVNPLPTGTLTFTETSGTTNDDGTVCSGDAVNFTAPSGYTNYNFKIGGVSVQNTSSNTYTTNFATSGNVTVEITSAATCTATLNTVAITVGTCGVKNTTTNKNYVTIQAAIDAVTTLDGNTITLSAGTYTENPIINKGVIILGPNEAIEPCTGTRIGEAILRTAIAGPAWSNSTNQILTIAANNVVIKGLTFEGNNSNLGSGIQIAEAIYISQANSGLTIENNIFQNLYQAGIDGSNGIATVASENHFVHNKFDNIPGNPSDSNGQFGIGILVYENLYAQIDNNCMTNVRVGIQTGNGHLANTGSTASISNNTISATRRGIFHNLQYSNASAYTISGNNITMSAGAKSGIMISSIQGTTGVNYSNNNITGGEVGVMLWNCPTSNLITINGGTITGSDYGVFANNYDGYNSNAETTTAAISGVTITESTIAGVYVKDNPLNSNGAGITLVVKDDCEIVGSGQLLKGILVEGADATALVQNNDASIHGFAIGIDVDGGTATINNNHIYNNGTGVRFTNAGKGTVHTNKFQGTTSNGKDIQATATAGLVSATQNNWFAGLTFGIENLSPTNIDATKNYWNAASGPSTVGFGTGANVSTNVTFCPILSDAPTAFGGTGTVLTGPSALSYTTSTNVYIEGTAITPNTATITGTTPFVFTASSLPPGLSISSSTGEISGTPTAPTVASNYTITATNSCGSTTTVLNITISAIPFVGGECSSLLNEIFASNPQLSNTDVNGAWYPDRYRPASFTANAGKLKISINAVDGAQLRPSGFSGSFYNTQGRKINQCSGCVTVAKADLYIPADWATNKRRSDLWATAFDASNAISNYPIIGFRNTTGSNPQMSVWDGTGWNELGAPSAGYNTSYTLEIRLSGSNLQYLINSAVVATYPSGGSVYFGNIIMQAYNFNDNTLGVSYDASPNNTYDALWDNVITSSASGNIVTNTNTNKSFCTIQAAINDVATVNGHIITATAGTYAENITVSKSVEIRGPNYGISPNGGTRVAEAIIVPATSAISTGEIIHVAASNVKVDGFTINGDNSLLTSGFSNTNEADIDAAEGITIYEDNINNLSVTNNILKNLSYFGVSLYGGSSVAATAGHSVKNNKFQDFGTYDAGSGIDFWGGGVLLYNDHYAEVSDNVMTNLRLGIQTGNFYRVNPGTISSQTINNNTIQARGIGIFHNLHYANASPFSLTNNTITGLADANETGGVDGILLGSLSVNSNLSNNNINLSGITATSIGIDVWNVKSTTPASINGGTLSNVNTGIFVNNYEGYGEDATFGGHATISGVTINLNSSGTGIKLLDSPSSTAHVSVEATIGSGVTINNGTSGIVVENTSAKILSPLGNVAFVGQSGDYIKLINNANDIDGGLPTFGGVLASAMSQSQRVTLEGKLTHKFDNAALGKICLPTKGVLSSSLTAVCLGGSANLSVAITSATGPFTVIYTDGTTPVTVNSYVSGTNIPIVVSATKTYSIVSITDAIGCISTTGFTGTPTITVNPLPTIGAGSDVAICTGGSTTLTATGASTYTWSPATGLSATTGAIITANPTATTTYTVTGTDANGCVNTDQVLVTVNSLPTVSAGSDQTVCEGSSVTLSGSGASTYTWSGGITNATAFVATTTAIYTVTGTDANGCVGTDDVTITVNPKPTGTNTTASAICSGTTLNYALTVNNGVNSTFTWVATTVPPGVMGASTTNQTGSTITDNLVNSNPFISGNASVVYTVTPTSVTGSCTGTPFTVTVPIKPSLSGTINAVPSNICAGSISQLNFGSPILGPNTGTVTMDYSDGTSTNTVTLNAGFVSVDVSPTATTTYSLISITANGCTKTLTGSTTVTVNQPPTLTIVSPPAVCSPATVDITTNTVQTANSGTTTKYYSTNTLAVAGGAGDITNQTAIAASGTYYIRSESSAGCYIVKPVTVVINPLPTLTIVNPAAVCSPATVDITTSAVQTTNTGTTTNYYSTNVLAIAGGTGDITTPTAIATSSTVYIRSELATGCYVIQPVTITINPLPTLTVVNPSAVCSPATVDITTSAVQTTNTGTTTKYYSTNALAIAGAAGDITNPSAIATSSTVYIRSELATGCYVIQPVTVTINPLPTFTTTFTNPSCDGATNGSITVTTSATSPQFSKNGGTNYVSGLSPYNFSTLANGTYSIKVKDANSCESVAQSVTLTQPASIVVTATSTPALCFGGNGSAALSATGGNNTYTFTSSGGSVLGSTLTAPAGTYTITATDGNNCVGTVSVTITQPAAALSATTSKVDVLCFGGATGSASVVVSGGTSPYTYAWSPSGSSAATATGLIAGTYTVLITDANSCTLSKTVTVGQPTTATSITASSTSPVCEASALNLTSTPTSSTGGLTYAWTGPNTFTASTQNASIATTTLLSAGIYTVKVTDGNSCTATATTAVVINPLPTIYTVSGTGVICSGVATPITLSGSTIGFNYKLTATGFGGSVLAGTGGALVFTPPSNILATYTIEATNPTTSCKVLMTGSVSTTNATNPTVTISAQTNVSCFGGSDGSVTTVASAGSGSYTYTFNGGVSQSTGVFNGKTAGTYPIVATDANTGCVGTVSAIITQPTSLPSATVASSGIACVGNTVTLTATATGGTAPYTYSWNGATATTSNTLAVTTTGTNILVVTDSKGCVVPTVSTTVTFNTPVPPTITGNSTLCSGSTLSLSTSAVGTYAWAGPNTFTSTSASISITNVQAVNAGIYTVTVTDINSCVASATANVVINITPTVSVTPTTAILSCTTPSTIITASGATTYSWTGTAGFTASTAAATITVGGTYIVTGVTNGCSATASVIITENKATPTITITPTSAVLTCLNPTTLITANGASSYSWTDNDGFTATTTAVTLNLAGTYIVTGTGINGCTSTVSVIVTEDKATPTISVTPTTAVLTCLTPSTAITASGANTYSWTGAGGFTATTAIANITAGGTYIVTGTGANGCTATSSVVITEDKATPTITVTPTTAVLTCLTPSTAITASGASTYSWTGAGGFTATTAIANITAGGTYIVTGTGINGCTSTVSVIVTEDKATPTINVTPTTAVLTCLTPSTAITASGASTYSWTGTGGFTATTAIANITAGGTYIVTGTGTNGCTSTVNVVITEDKATPTISVTPTTAVLTCLTPSTTITASGASTYSWTGTGGFTATTAIATITAGGTYIVTGTGTNGCTSTVSVIVTEDKATPTIGVTPTTAVLTCLTPSTAITASGANTYSWTGTGGFTATTAIANITAGGTYIVTGTGSNGCTATASVIVTEDKATPTVNIINAVSTLNCTTPTTTIIANAGSSATYTWTGPGSFTAITALINVSIGGNYIVTATGTNGCTATASVIVTEDKATPTISVTPTTAVLTCLTPSTTITASGANTYSWTGTGGFTATTAIATITAGGTYIVTGTGTNGCTSTVSVTITEDKATPTVLVTPTTAVLTCLTPSTAITASGANTYSWTGTGGFTATTAIANITAGGTYIVTGTGTNGCTSTVSVIVTEDKATPTVLVTPTTAVLTCLTPSTAITASGASTYSWTGTGGFTATTAIANITAGGTYIVTGTGTNGCTSTVNVVITEDKAMSTISVTPTTAVLTCLTPSTAITASGASTYSWTGTGGFTATTAIANITAGGIYIVTGTGSNGCTATASVTITEDKAKPIVLVTPTTAVLTCGSPTTTITAGGADTYSWTKAGGGFTATTATADILVGGVYTVVGTSSANGCTAMATIEITENKTTPTISVTPTTAVLTCLNPTTLITASGASLYSWTDNDGFTATTSAVTLNLAGTYIVTGTGANGCTATASITITENKTTPTVSITPTTAIVLTCTSPTTTITAGGADTYSWTKAGGGFTATTATADILVGGIYTVVGTSSANGCTAMATIEITENKTTPTVTATTALAILTCANPTTTITAGGADTYSWTKAGGGFTATTATADILVGGVYTVVGTSSANGCTAMATIEITENKTTPTISVTPTTAVLTCGSPTTTITAGGADTYSWTKAGGGFTATTATADILVGGIYTVVGTSSANGCTAMATIEITENKTTPTISVTPTTAVLTCLNPTTLITASGASLYSWTDNDGFTATTSAVTLNLAGTYIVTGTGANGCTATASVTITEDKATPTVSVTPTTAVLTCLTPSTAITASGADTYSWTGTGGFTATTAIATITAQGTYVVTGTGANGCTATSSVVITEDKAKPTISVTPTTAVLTCLTPSTAITASGASTYSWTGTGGFTATTAIANITAGGTYIVTGTGTNGCTSTVNVVITEDKATPTISVTPTTAVLTCLTPSTAITASGASTYSWTGTGGFTATTAIANITAGGTYIVNGTGTNGCTATSSVIITEDKVEPTATVTGSGTLCSGSTISLTATGGGTYQWSGPNSFTSTSAAVSIANATVANSGTYIVTVTNANGCTASAMATITVNPVVAVPSTQAFANIATGESITLTATGCSGTLLWFKSSDNSPVSMPVSPTVMTSYYAKCEVTTNGVTCTSAKSADVVITVGVITSIKTGGAWENPTTWDANRVPLSTDEVVIDSNHNVIITTMNAVAKKVRYKNNGTISFGNPATKLAISGL